MTTGILTTGGDAQLKSTLTLLCIDVCVTPFALSPPDCMFESCPSTFPSNHVPYCDITLYFKHLHPCIRLHPDIDALHYGINNSRVANYERFLFKRLSGSSEQLFNCSTQPYQCKSRRPCKKKKKKKNKVLLTIRYQRRVLHCKSEVSCSVFVCADVDLDNLCAEKETVSLMNPLIGSVIGCS